MDEWAALMKLWERAAVTPEQVIGQLLRHGEAQGAQIVTLQRRLDQVEATLSGRSGSAPAAGKPAGR
jgi:predicted transcriptional regulator